MRRWAAAGAVAAAGIWLAYGAFRPPLDTRAKNVWQSAVSPGRLSSAHAFLENNCAACHTSYKGVEAANCITCHADNQSLLQRQPTAFHGTVQSCAECHIEHFGEQRRLTAMSHEALASLGRRLGSTSGVLTSRLEGRLGATGKESPETLLNCFACHSNEDRHNGFFGKDCMQCHTTAAWTISAYRHPSPASTSCAQCHAAPPSHYMEHFRMVSMMIAHQESARVDQCFLCHQTTAWNDIKGRGWYKHH